MKIEQMRQSMLAAKVGDWLIVREGGAQRRYRVTEITGPEHSRQLYMLGINGADRRLVDRVEDIMLVRTLKDEKTEGRRVSEVLFEGRIETRVGTSVMKPEPLDIAVERSGPERERQHLGALELAELIRCRTTTQIAAWVIDRMAGEALHGNEFADETMRAMQVFVASRERLPEIER